MSEDRKEKRRKREKEKGRKRRTDEKDAKDALFSDLSGDTWEAGINEGEDCLHDVETHDTKRGIDSTGGQDDGVGIGDQSRVSEDCGKEVKMFDGCADDLRHIDVFIAHEIEENVEKEDSVSNLVC